MTARDARRRDDGQDDPDNPIVPFRMSDRRALDKVTWWLTGISALLVLMFSAILMR
jgi:hypothetical protein